MVACHVTFCTLRMLRVGHVAQNDLSRPRLPYRFIVMRADANLDAELRSALCAHVWIRVERIRSSRSTICSEPEHSSSRGSYKKRAWTFYIERACVYRVDIFWKIFCSSEKKGGKKASVCRVDRGAASFFFFLNERRALHHSFSRNVWVSLGGYRYLRNCFAVKRRLRKQVSWMCVASTPTDANTHEMPCGPTTKPLSAHVEELLIRHANHARLPRERFASVCVWSLNNGNDYGASQGGLGLSGPTRRATGFGR